MQQSRLLSASDQRSYKKGQIVHNGLTDCTGLFLIQSGQLRAYTNEITASRFSDVMWLVDQIMWKSFDRRLAAFLLEESSLENTSKLKTTHEIIGNHLGTAARSSPECSATSRMREW